LPASAATLSAWRRPSQSTAAAAGDLLLALKTGGLSGVEFVVSDDHPGLKKAIEEIP
jgi:transposase-like protein